MKKIFVLIVLGLNFCFVYSQKKEDPVVMTIAEKEIPLSEFLFLAQKDSAVNLLDKKSLDNYVELFKNFKLKVADAESLGIHESKTFQEELDNYEAQLRASFLSDKEGEAAAVRKVYNRGEYVLSLSHIAFKLHSKSVLKDTVSVYEKANEVYKRILAGEDFTTLGETLAEEEKSGVVYEKIEALYPLQTVKAFEDAAYSLSVGEISAPVRSTFGYHLLRLDRKIPDPGIVRVAHILIGFPDESKPQEDGELLKRANEVYEKAKNGDDFEGLAKEYSTDVNTSSNGGVLPYFALGEMVKPFEQTAFSLTTDGEISKPVKTRFGYHIIKLLDKKQRPPFEELERSMYLTMKQGERNFELFNAYDEREKAKFGYTFNQAAYDELMQLCSDYFPTDTAFYNRGSQMTKTLMHLDGVDYPQNEFVEYLTKYPFSAKTYAGDFLNEVYDLFVRTIVTELEKRNLDTNYPEYEQLVKEYHDGILLFEISNQKIWEKPVEEQAQLEKEWIKELSNKYKVDINWKVLKNIKKYIK